MALRLHPITQSMAHASLLLINYVIKIHYIKIVFINLILFVPRAIAT